MVKKEETLNKAENKVCTCGETQNNVYLETVPGEGTEFETLDTFYCKKCNAFWREP